MGHRRFDALTRVLAQLLDRRETLAAALTLLLATLISGDVAAAKKGGKGGKGGKGKGKKGKKKKKKRRSRGESSITPRDCSLLGLAPGADLHGCNLTGHSFIGADLTNADLSDANLGGVFAEGVSFRGARLWRAHLGASRLKGAKFDRSPHRRTDLFGANFASADLRDVTFEDAIYSHYANFTGATFCNTTMAGGAVNNAACPPA